MAAIPMLVNARGCFITTYLNFCKISANRRPHSFSFLRGCSSSSTETEGSGNSGASPPPTSKSIATFDVELFFLNPTVQKLLSQIRGMDMEKVFRPIKTSLKAPWYEFATTERVQELQNKAKRRALRKLMMPPVMKERKPITEVISKDPEIQGYTKTKFLFIDLSQGPTNRERIIVARDTDGTLRHASWEERHWMNQIFFPIPGRKLRTPKLFLDENLEHLLEQQHFEFLLEYACVQFDPDDPDYIRVTRKVYDYIDKVKKFDALRSTRHFGTMAIHLVLSKNIDNMLLDMIQRELIDDAASLIQVYCIAHRDCVLNTMELPKDNNLEIVKMFIVNEAKKRSHLELAMQSYQELMKQKLEMEKNIQMAHGAA